MGNICCHKDRESKFNKPGNIRTEKRAPVSTPDYHGAQFERKMSVDYKESNMNVRK